MTDQPRLRDALRDLAAGAAPPAVATGAVVGLAGRMRRRRYAQTAVAAAASVLLAGFLALSPDRADPGGFVVRPRPTPPSPPAGAPASPAATPQPAAESEPETEPERTGRGGGNGGPGPAASPTAAGPSATPASPEPDPEPEPSEPAPEEPYQAVPKPTCNLVVDARGDATPLPADSLDIVSGDLASGPEYVAARVKVASLAGNDPRPQGATWAFGWTLGAREYLFTADEPFGGGSVTAKLAAVDTRDGVRTETADVTVKVDPAAGTVTWQVAREHLPDLAEGSDKFHTLHAYTASGSAGDPADTAKGTHAYGDQRPSCLKAG